MNQTITQRLAAIRQEMADHGIDLFVQPNADPHLSEYLPEHWKCLAWASNFTGEAGTLVITPTEAALWTDSRFFVQGEEQLAGTSIQLMRGGLPETPSVAQYIADRKPACLGYDGRLFAVRDEAQYFDLARRLCGCAAVTDFDPFETLWSDRTPESQAPLEIYGEELSGEGTPARLTRIIAAVQQAGGTHLLLTRLDDVAWALNVRGADIHCTPVCNAFALLAKGDCRLFVDPQKVSDEARATLSAQGITLYTYGGIYQALNELGANARLIANEGDLTVALRAAFSTKLGEWMAAGNPIPLMRAIKNETELEGYRQAMIKDGVALVRFYRRLEAELAAGHRVTELGCVDWLVEFRSEQALYREESFDAIVAWGAHAAMPHYYPSAESSVEIVGDGLLLIDTGGQYMDGTTDITRTIAVGQLTDEMRQDFTRVLKGHIRLAQACFPRGTRGDQLDALARMDLWQVGKTYRHGTSHGVGHYLGVHEGPESVRMEHNPQVLMEGMVLSNEPGLYLAGRYGIRHENCVAVRHLTTTDEGPFYRLETLTLYPFDLTAVDMSMLTADERAWINAYHESVYTQLSPHLTQDEAAWLRQKTQSI